MTSLTKQIMAAIAANNGEPSDALEAKIEAAIREHDSRWSINRGACSCALIEGEGAQATVQIDPVVSRLDATTKVVAVRTFELWTIDPEYGEYSEFLTSVVETRALTPAERDIVQKANDQGKLALADLKSITF